MAIDPKFADAVKLRFSKGASVDKSDDDTEDSGSDSDAEDFRLLKSAWNAGNGPDFCEILRRINNK